MSAHAGEETLRTGDLYCTQCNEKVHVTKGNEIPSCPNGHTTFETRRDEPGNKP